MTQDNPSGRKVARTGAAEVLEVFGDAVPRRDPGGGRGRGALSGGPSWVLLLRLDSNQ